MPGGVHSKTWALKIPKREQTSMPAPGLLFFQRASRFKAGRETVGTFRVFPPKAIRGGFSFVEVKDDKACPSLVR